MGCPVMVFEDREETMSEVRQDLIERGFKPDVSTRPRAFNDRLNAVPPNHCGWLIDNHIDKCESLKEFGKPHVHTEHGSLAGYKIISEILLPRMKSGNLPPRPIGLMSGRGLGRARSLFKSRFDTNRNVFFFQKDDSSTAKNSEFRRYLDALQKCDELEAPRPEMSREQIALKMIESFQQTFRVSDTELDRIFRVRKGLSVAKQISSGEVEMNSEAWEEMAAVLFKIRIALDSVFSKSQDPGAACRQWLKRAKLPPRQETPIKLLLSGEYRAAYRVLKAATFPIEFK